MERGTVMLQHSIAFGEHLQWRMFLPGFGSSQAGVERKGTGALRQGGLAPSAERGIKGEQRAACGRCCSPRCRLVQLLL